jgi:multiple antibiotic resistance protein
MDPTLLSATLLLIIVIDPLGNVPLFLACLAEVPPEKRVKVIIREVLIGSVVLFLFLFMGKNLIALLQLSEESIAIAGGIILFLIALRMIFPSQEGIMGKLPEGEPFIFPLAIPLFAGPSAMATVMLFATGDPANLGLWALALFIACLISGSLLSASGFLLRIMGKKGLTAFERLMGLILAAVSVEMLIRGIEKII